MVSARFPAMVIAAAPAHDQGPRHLRGQVRRFIGVEALVQPLAADGQAMYRQPALVQRVGQVADIVGPIGELGGAAADLLR